MIRALFFDFDGVVMDSMHLKLEAYCHAFAGQGFASDEVNRIQTREAGIARQRLLGIIYRELKGEELPPELYESALERFNQHDEASRVRMDFVPGSQAFLDKVRGRYFTAVVTGTPQDVIDRTVAHFGLGPYFDKVCGSPVVKVDHLQALAASRGLRPDQCVYIGDAVKDQEASVACGMPFAGLDRGDHPFDADKAWIIVESLHQLEAPLDL
jgi:phosphoglycolate phosphatase-like HAD superfamily hydrolase